MLAIVGGAAAVLARKATVSPPTTPSPTKESPAAASLNAGVQAWRDGSMGKSREYFLKAVDGDPTLARAHLFLAVESLWASTDARRHLERAWQYRDQLDASERSLAEAYTPALDTEPDLTAARTRTAATCQQHPDSALCVFALATLDMRLARLSDVSAEIDAFLLRDPSFVVGLDLKGDAQTIQGDVPGARRSYEACLERSAYATSCLADISGLDQNEGDCAGSEKFARRLTVALPHSAVAIDLLACAVFGRGGSLTSAREVLSSGWASAGEDPPALEAEQAAKLAVLEGRFDDAIAKAATWGSAIQKSPDEGTHASHARFSAGLMLEIGQLDDAVRTARDFGVKRDAWQPDPYSDFSILSPRVQYLSGALGRTEYVEALDKWLHRPTASPALVGMGGQRWIAGYAEAVLNKKDALFALAALPGALPLPDAQAMDPGLQVPIGNVYLKGGQLAEALVHLRRATRSCHAVDMPISHTQAFLLLAQALEQSGDAHGACDAYGVVVERWGADGRSRSAVEARAGSRRLACASKLAAPPISP